MTEQEVGVGTFEQEPVGAGTRLGGGSIEIEGQGGVSVEQGCVSRALEPDRLSAFGRRFFTGVAIGQGLVPVEDQLGPAIDLAGGVRSRLAYLFA